MMGSMGERERNLDVTTSSMDVLALNNLVVSMRPLVRRVRTQIINRITHLIKKYKNKKGTEAQILSNQKRADRLVEEIHLIKRLKYDQIAKQALANQQSLQEATVQADLRMRAFVRFATHKQMCERVDKFRREHDDWSSLAAFLLSKNTGRRMKKRKKKNKPGEVVTKSGVDGITTEGNAVRCSSGGEVCPKEDDDDNCKEHVQKEGHKLKKVAKCGDQSPDLEDEDAADDERMSTDGDATDTDDDDNDDVNDSDETSSHHSKCNEDVDSPDGDVDDDDVQQAKDTEILDKSRKVDDQLTTSPPPANKKPDAEFSSHNKSATTTTLPTGVLKRADVIKRQDREMVVRVFDINDPDSLLETKPSDLHGCSSEGVQRAKKGKDSFFLTDSGSEDDQSSTEEDNAKDEQEDMFVGKLSEQGVPQKTGVPVGGDTQRKSQHVQSKMSGRGRDNHASKSSTGANHGQKRGRNYPPSLPTHDHRSDMPRVAASSKGKIPAKLHPSWEASRKRKLQTSLVASVGKRTTFDDE